MRGGLLNRKNILYVVSVLIAVCTIYYAQYLAEHIASDEKKRIETWVAAQQTIAASDDDISLGLAAKISSENRDIPIIETDENDHINVSNSLNLDSTLIAQDTSYLPRKLARFKKQHNPIILVLSDTPYIANRYYYGDSLLQQQVRYFPIAFLLVTAVFVYIIYTAQRAAYKSEQNQLWVGMAKETAHQLGTPITSLKGWMEVLKEKGDFTTLTTEMEKDITRLDLISDRFGKIGSQPQLEEVNLVSRVDYMVDYMKKRAGGRVQFNYHYPDSDIPALISPPLFDWVLENLLKNALDAMEGKGIVSISISDLASQVYIDITDNGKGIRKADVGKIFNPGFSTKKRGWGLGLTLSKRIIEQYHKGSLFVKQSEPAQGTTFRIILNK
jgi:signal transduction histidine kinase